MTDVVRYAVLNGQFYSVPKDTLLETCATKALGVNLDYQDYVDFAEGKPSRFHPLVNVHQFIDFKPNMPPDELYQYVMERAGWYRHYQNLAGYDALHLLQLRRGALKAFLPEFYRAQFAHEYDLDNHRHFTGSKKFMYKDKEVYCFPSEPITEPVHIVSRYSDIPLDYLKPIDPKYVSSKDIVINFDEYTPDKDCEFYEKYIALRAI